MRTLGAPSSCGQRTRVSSSQRLPNLPGLGFSPPRNPVRDLGPEAEEGGCSLDDRASRAPGQLGARGPVHQQNCLRVAGWGVHQTTAPLRPERHLRSSRTFPTRAPRSPSVHLRGSLSRTECKI